MAFSTTEWGTLINALKDVEAVDKACKAADRLHKDSTPEDVPKLMELLKDTDAFVREAAAWPISELVGPPALKQLLPAYQQGLDEGLDCDGFTAALIDLVEVRPDESVIVLRLLIEHAEPSIRENALWLLQFCQPAPATPYTAPPTDL